MKIFELAESRSGEVHIELGHHGVEVVATDRHRLRGAPAEITQHEIVRGLFFLDHNRFALGLDAEFDHAVIIRFPAPSIRYPQPGGTRVVEP